MATWTFGLEDRISGPATQADRALEGLDREIRATDKALRDLNRTSKQTRLNQALGLDITKQQRDTAAR